MNISYAIGEVSHQLQISVDTLRYYEKIALLPKISRTKAGIRRYDAQDISRLKFIKRAQRMNFSLAEIADLLKMREDPQHARLEVRKLTASKLSQVMTHINELETLRKELQLLLNLCQATEGGCPILDGMGATRDVS